MTMSTVIDAWLCFVIILFVRLLVFDRAYKKGLARAIEKDRAALQKCTEMYQIVAHKPVNIDSMYPTLGRFLGWILDLTKWKAEQFFPKVYKDE